MFRRQFVQFITAAGTTSLVSVAAAEANETKSITYVVKGFSCVTCAVGLDTMLQKQDGVTRSKSTYPDGVVRIEFDPQKVTEASLKTFIGEMGFTVEEERKA
jgi:copper chaperone CopZ